MEKALCNGQLRMAYKVARDEELEKEIRRASRAGEILCPDIECKAPILKYCHGNLRTYFSHKAKGACDYAVFDKKDNEMFREVRHVLYEHFSEKGYNVFQEEKILPNHYAHLVLSSDQLESNKRIAIEFGDVKTPPQYIRKINEEYHAQGIHVNWLLVDNEQRYARMEYRKFLQWYLHCGASNRKLVVISSNISEVAMYKERCNPNEFPQILGTIEELDIVNGEIVLRKNRMSN